MWTGSFGSVDPEAIPPPLMTPRHLRRYMAKLLLKIAFIDLCGRGEPGA